MFLLSICRESDHNVKILTFLRDRYKIVRWTNACTIMPIHPDFISSAWKRKFNKDPEFQAIEDRPKIIQNKWRETKAADRKEVSSKTIRYMLTLQKINIGKSTHFVPGATHISRCIGNMSTSILKFFECMCQIYPDEPITHISCLADRTGSIIHAMAHLEPNAKLSYNTLLGDRQSGVDTTNMVFLKKYCPVFRTV